MAVRRWNLVQHPGDAACQDSAELGCGDPPGRGVGADVLNVKAVSAREQPAQVRRYATAREVAVAPFREEDRAVRIPDALEQAVVAQRGQPELLTGGVDLGDDGLAFPAPWLTGCDGRRRRRRGNRLRRDTSRHERGNGHAQRQEAVVASRRTVMIHFGTSGWRGIVGQDFTFRNVRLVLDATLEVLRRRGDVGEIIVSYDTRLLSEKFAREAVAVLTHHGATTVMSERDLPSPCLAYAVRERGATLGVMFTASHNPAEYNGLKLFTSHGMQAPRDLTGAIEAEVEAKAKTFEDFYVPQPRLASTAPLTEAYLASLERDLDWEAIARSGLVVAVDPLFGTAREFLDRVLLAHDVPTHVVHTTKDPYFGGYAPECTPLNLAGLREKVRTSGAQLGLATDGDADRFGVVDRACRAISPNLIIALLTEYLIVRRHVTGGVGRTVATTRLVDRITGKAGCELAETPVGFHYFGPLFLSGRISIATEESAGLGVARHLPERDGIYAALLMAELVAVEGRAIVDLVHGLFERYGTLVSRRVQFSLREKTRSALDRVRKKTFKDFVGQKVTRADRSDGLLLELADGSWVLTRAAGTEPKLRIYAEAPSSRQLRALVQEARLLVRRAEEDVSHVRD
jgi:phosphoglucomutase